MQKNLCTLKSSVPQPLQPCYENLYYLYNIFFNNCIQIADFGMSRDLMYESFYVSHGGMIPVKWTAPEVRTKHNNTHTSNL